MNRQSNSMGMQQELLTLVNGNQPQVKAKVKDGCAYDSVQQINNQKMKIPGAKAKVAVNLKEGTRHSLLLNPQDKENENMQNLSRQGWKQTKDFLKKPFMSVAPPQAVLAPQYKNFTEQQREIEKSQLSSTYGQDIYSYLAARNEKTEFSSQGFLDRHEITGRLRAKMIDWMVEVLCSYKCSEQTFFCAVFMMDEFFRKSTRKVKVSELHILGVVAMWMASKYEEIYPLRLKTLEQKIAHGKLSQADLKNKETEMMAVLEFQLEEGSVYEQALLLAQLLDLEKLLGNRKTYDYFNKVIVYLTKMVMHDYSLLTSVPKNYLATASLYVSFKIIEQIAVSFPTSQACSQLLRLSGQNEDKLFDAAQKVLNLAKNFETLFPSLENLKKFNGFSMGSEKLQ